MGLGIANPRHRSGPRVDAQLREHVLEVPAHGSRRDPELPGDLGVGRPFGHQQHEDQGTWRQPTEEATRDRGRGILLMEKLMTRAEIRRRPTGTRVVLEQAL